MKSLLRSFITLAAIFTFASYVAKADTEPDNNTPAGADLMAQNDSVSGNIASTSADFYDYYVFTTTQDGDITLTLKTDNGGYRYLYLYDSDGSTQLGGTANYGPSPIQATVYGLAAGTYYALVYTNSTSYTGSYTLLNSIATPAIANDVEPNDSYTSALPMTENGSVSGHIAYRFNGGSFDGSDYYQFTTTSDGSINLSLTTDNTGYRYIYLYDNNGTTQLGSASNFGPGPVSFTVNGLAAGTYYALVYTNSNNYYGGYTLTNTVTPDGITNDIEPNDDPAHALTMAENGSVSGHIAFRFNGGSFDGSDYYQFTTTNDGSISLSLATDNTGYRYINLYDADGTTLLGSAADYGPDPVSFTVNGLAAGTYYARVYTNSNSYYGGYTLTNSVTTDAITNDTEPNNIPDEAGIMLENGSVTGHIAYRLNGGSIDNYDYYKFTTSNDGNITLSLTTYNTGYRYIYLYDNNGTTQLGGAADYGPDPVSFTTNGLAAGTYYALVYTSSNSYYGGYILTNTVTPASVPNDPEPNDAFASASPMLSTDTVTGHIAYRYNGGAIDNNDYWKLSNCVPGDITATVTNDNGNYIYLYLYNSSFSQIASGAAYGSVSISKTGQAPGIYYLLVYTNTNSYYSGYQLISNLASVIPPLTVSVTSTTNATCGLANGAIDITASGGTPDYAYSWSNSSTSEDLSSLNGGTYNVTVTDVNGCVATTSASISQSTAVELSETHTNVSCAGGSNGSIDLTATGGIPSYTYSWSNGATTEDVSALAAGSYTVTVTDQVACSASTSVSITQPNPISISSSVTDPLCNGDENGSIDITVNGGTSPYGYSWSNSATSEDISGIGAGTYSVTVTDHNGCTKSKNNIAVTDPAVLSASESHTDVTTQGGSDGSIDVTVTGGTTPYSYLWNDGATTEDRSGLSVGNYSVIITDAHGCTSSLSIDIHEPGCNLSLSTQVTDALCNGDANGAIDLTVNGANGSVSYSWNDGTTSEDRTGLTAGTYSVTVTDEANCSANTSATVHQPDVLSPSETHTDVSTNGGSDGSIDVTVSGGTTPYSYLWNDGATTEDRSGLSAGSYSVVITDAHSCSSSLSVDINQPGCNLSLSTQVTDALCNGDANGAIDLTVNGANGNVTYSWNDGATSEDRTGLTAGTYYVTVSDEANCSASTSATVHQPDVLSASETHTDETSAGAHDGTIDVTVSGGTSPYSYAWNDGATSQDRTGLSAGDYSVAILDSHGCSTSLDVTISVSGCVCQTPTNVTITGLENDMVQVCWDAQSCASGYILQYHWKGHTNWITMDITSPDHCGTFDLEGHADIYVRVATICTDGSTTAYTDPILYHYKSPCVAPSDLYITDLTSSSVTFHWTPGTTTHMQAVHYNVSGSTVTYGHVLSASASQWSAWSLQPSTTYGWRVKGDCYSVTKRFTTPSGGQDKLDNNAETALMVYPNPTSSLVQVSYQNVSDGTVTMRIFDITGKVMYNQQMQEPAGSVSSQLDISAFAAGVYTLQVIMPDGTVANQKIVKVQK